MLDEARKSSQIVKKAGQKAKEKAEIPAKREKTALVLSGGASRGAYEMGVWQALRELGITIDMVCGTSIGAMNAYIVALGSYEKARDMWLDMKTEEVFDFDRVLQEGAGSFTGIRDILAKDFPEEEVRASKTDFGLCTVRLNEEASMDPKHSVARYAGADILLHSDKDEVARSYRRAVFRLRDCSDLPHSPLPAPDTDP
ncbi:MAG: patatin-like phospholipase family protein [Oscillospiraceae bacterium]|nr:patatin-like phospholipase family protein [Oscillospiraceae bacterium]